MTVLVTGANGFLGAAVCRALLTQGRSVRALVRPTSDVTNLEALAVETVTGDLRDPGSLGAALRGCDGVYHVAADYRLWAPRPADLYESNVEGTRHLMTAALEAGVRRVVYTSSVAVLGIEPGDAVSDESTPVGLADMIGHYKRSKFLAEEVAMGFARDGAPVVIVNPSTPIGPGDVKPTPTGRVVLDAVRGKIPAFVDTGLNVAHVDDVAKGHLQAMDAGQPGERYILGGEDLTLEEILTIACRHAGRRVPTTKLAHWMVMPVAVVSETLARCRLLREPLATVDGVRMARKKMYFSSAKAQRELGYRYRPAAEAITDAVDWFQHHAMT